MKVSFTFWIPNAVICIDVEFEFLVGINTVYAFEFILSCLTIRKLMVLRASRACRSIIAVFCGMMKLIAVKTTEYIYRLCDVARIPANKNFTPLYEFAE